MLGKPCAQTDEDTLILHAADDDDGGGPLLDISAVLDEAGETDGGGSEAAVDQTLAARLAAHLPRMPAGMRADLLPLLRGNLAHVAAVRRASRASARTLDVEHCECVPPPHALSLRNRERKENARNILKPANKSSPLNRFEGSKLICLSKTAHKPMLKLDEQYHSSQVR
jgi:hypothetical protein